MSRALTSRCPGSGHVHARGQTLTGYGLLSSRQSGTRNINVRFDSKANGTGVLRQFASKATRLSSRVAFLFISGLFPAASGLCSRTMPTHSRKRSPPASRMLELPAASRDGRHRGNPVGPRLCSAAEPRANRGPADAHARRLLAMKATMLVKLSVVWVVRADIHPTIVGIPNNARVRVVRRIVVWIGRR